MLQLGGVLHGAGREGEIISSPPLHSRVKAAVCQHGGAKVLVRPSDVDITCSTDARLNLNHNLLYKGVTPRVKAVVCQQGENKS